MNDLHDILLSKSDFGGETLTCSAVTEPRVCVTYEEYKTAIESGESLIPLIVTNAAPGSTSKTEYEKCTK